MVELGKLCAVVVLETSRSVISVPLTAASRVGRALRLHWPPSESVQVMEIESARIPDSGVRMRKVIIFVL